MKKAIAASIIIIFVFSLIPLALAERGDNSKVNLAGIQEDIKVNTGETLRDDREKIKDIRADYRQKIEQLGQEKIEKIAALKKDQIETLSELSSDRLERISNLSEDRLERLSGLGKEKIEKIADLNDSDIDKISSLNMGRINQLIRLDSARLKEQLKNLRIIKVRSADDLDERNISSSIRARLNEVYEKQKEDFKEAKDRMEEARKELKNAKNNSSDNATIQSARDYLLSTSDALISQLGNIKVKVQESQNIDNATEAKITAEIDSQIADINSLKANIQAATTKQQIKEYAQKLRKKWNVIRHLIELHTQRIIASRVDGIINEGLVLEKRLDNIIERANKQNITINVSSEISSFSDKITIAKDEYIQAQANLSEALDLRVKGEPADSDKIKALVDNANKLLAEARNSIKDAQEILKSIVKKIKDAMPDADISADTEVEVEAKATA